MKKILQKNIKSPQLDMKKDNKHTYSTCFSITIRTGHGILLGSDSVNAIIQWFSSDDKLASILVTEQIGLDTKTQHFQGGVFFESPVRQDKIRDKLLPLVIQMFKEQNPLYASKAMDAIKKHSLKIVSHNSFPVLYSYCTKTVDANYELIHFERYGPWTPHQLSPKMYCKHDWPYWADIKCKHGPCTPDLTVYHKGLMQLVFD